MTNEKAAGKPSLKPFDWYCAPIRRNTQVTMSYRYTQTVRRFFKAACGDHFRFDRPFMAWMKNGKPKTMGEAAKEWLRREAKCKAD